MPRKKTEELETETTPAESADVAGVVAESSEENAVAAETNSAEEGKNEPASILGSIAETVGAAVGSLAATVTGGISSVVTAAVSGDSPTTEAEKSHHSKRAERIGIVQSDKMTKTVTVRVDRQIKHPIYRKYIKRRKKFMAHDELGSAVGDKVRIMETRPLSARKRWRVVEILQKAVK